MGLNPVGVHTEDNRSVFLVDVSPSPCSVKSVRTYPQLKTKKNPKTWSLKPQAIYASQSLFLELETGCLCSCVSSLTWRRAGLPSPKGRWAHRLGLTPGRRAEGEQGWGGESGQAFSPVPCGLAPEVT